MKKPTPKKILVVDDEKPLAKALELKLSHIGYDVITAFDGKEALDAINEHHFDLILLDLVMPKLDGFGVLDTLNDQNKRIPTIVTSNLSQKEDAARAKELGALEYFVKSNTPLSDIVNFIKSIVDLQ